MKANMGKKHVIYAQTYSRNLTMIRRRQGSVAIREKKNCTWL